MTLPERFLAAFGSLIAIANGAASLWGGSSIDGGGYLVTHRPPIGYLPGLFILFLVLEFFLNWVFAEIVVRLTFVVNETILRMLIGNFAILFSAWISIFNLQWLLIGNWSEAGPKQIIFGLLGVIAFSSLIHVVVLNRRASGEVTTKPRREQFANITIAFHLLPFITMATLISLSQGLLG